MITMGRRFFAHYLCYKDQIYPKHILSLNDNNQVCEIQPFTNEIANTLFYNGILIVSSKMFHSHLDEFLFTLKKQLRMSGISIPQAIIENSIYHKYIPDMQDSCSLYNIPTIYQEIKGQEDSINIEINTIIH